MIPAKKNALLTKIVKDKSLKNSKVIQIDCYSDNEKDLSSNKNVNGTRRDNSKSLDIVIRAAYRNYKDIKRMSVGKTKGLNKK